MREMTTDISWASPYYDLMDLVLLRAITSIHAGTGRAGGTVDLPIQRDEYDYPCIYSSSIKGALKTALLHAFAKTPGSDYEKARGAVQALLGSDPEEGESFESSIAILDAYLLAIPTRSLKGVYAYLTSPFLLKRFYERLEQFKTNLGDREEQKLEKPETGSGTDKSGGEPTQQDPLKSLMDALKKIVDKEPEPDRVICFGEKKDCEGLKVPIQGGRVVLAEEFVLGLNYEQIEQVIINFLRNVLRLDRPLLIASDEIAKEIIDRSLIRYTRVKLRRETKTVETGGLWTEEYLPPKALLYTLMMYKKPSLSSTFVKRVIGKDPDQGGMINEDDYLEALKTLNLLKEDDVKKIKGAGRTQDKLHIIVRAIEMKTRSMVAEQLKGYLILGGHETIGKGIVKLETFDGGSLVKHLRGGQ